MTDRPRRFGPFAPTLALLFLCILVNYVDRGDLIAAGYLIWSVATTATGLVQGFALLIMLRFLLGIGESVVFPACSKILACHVMEEGRGFATGVVTSPG